MNKVYHRKFHLLQVAETFNGLDVSLLGPDSTTFPCLHCVIEVLIKCCLPFSEDRCELPWLVHSERYLDHLRDTTCLTRDITIAHSPTTGYLRQARQRDTPPYTCLNTNAQVFHRSNYSDNDSIVNSNGRNTPGDCDDNSTPNPLLDTVIGSPHSTHSSATDRSGDDAPVPTTAQRHQVQAPLAETSRQATKAYLRHQRQVLHRQHEATFQAEHEHEATLQTERDRSRLQQEEKDKHAHLEVLRLQNEYIAKLSRQRAEAQQEARRLLSVELAQQQDILRAETEKEEQESQDEEDEEDKEEERQTERTQGASSTGSGPTTYCSFACTPIEGIT